MLFAVALLWAISAANAVAPVWSPTGCGQSKYADAGDMFLPAGYIVGGEQARAHEFPWQASVRRKATDSHFCGGIVINQRWVMTAAHCTDGETAGLITAVVGDYIRSATDAENPARQRMDVAAIHQHAGYNSRTMENDISLLQLASDIVLSEDVQPVCAPDPDDLYTYRKSQCSGWGTLTSGGVCCPDVLWYVTLNVTTNAFCQTEYGVRYTIYSDMICASDNNGGDDRDSCQGDSGGPLTIKEADGTFRVVGIVSWGIGCASGYPGVYCRVGEHTDWVTGIIGAVH